MSAHSPEMVRWMLQTLGLPTELVGRPNSQYFLSLSSVISFSSMVPAASLI